MGVNGDVIEIKGVWAWREGDHIIVEVWMPDGSYREVIREHIDANFSHCVHSSGIREAKEVVR